MKKILFWIALLFTCISLNAQDFQDNFDDLSFPADPMWFGNTDIYEVNTSGELQLMDTAAGESFIYAPIATADSTTWEFFFRLEFNPSTDNNLKVFLKSNSSDFDNSLQGYYLQIGLAGAEDSIQLRRQDGSSTTLLLGGTMGAVAVAPAVRIRVVRTDDAIWSLYADYTGGSSFGLEGSVLDDTYNEGAFFGFQCLYGVTRRDKFFFDDIAIGPVVQDEQAPSLLSAMALDANTISLQFSEPLDPASVELEGNYLIDNGVIVNNANLDTDPSIVVLEVSTLTSGTNYTVSAENISDINGNFSSSEQTTFTFFILEPAEPFDILINELFPNPDTDISNLPNTEFIELYNQSNKAIDLDGFEIFDASNTKVLPNYILAPESYLIICNEEDVAAYSGFGNVLGVPGLFALNDSGDDAGLRDADGILIHEVSFTPATFQDEDKDDGGWSLELVNPNLYCQGASNWRASISNIGGTPGQINSLFDDTPDTASPQLVDVIAISENQVRIIFNETMGESSSEISAYAVSNAGAVINAELEEGLNAVLLTLSTPFFLDQEQYTLTIQADVTDCSGNSIDGNTFVFTYYETQPAELYDIVISEFYPDFSPSFGLPEKEFVELFNRSDKTINLEGFIVNNGTENIELPFFLLQPDAYVILYESGGQGFGAFGDTIALPNFIGLGNEGDVFGLFDSFGQLIHFVGYNLGTYQDNDKVDGGWSIEMINTEAPCSFDTNWRASVEPIGGTPGRQNSVNEEIVDDTSLDLIRAFPESPTQLRLTFNKSVDEATAIEIENYFVDGFTIISIDVILPYNIVLLEFAEEMEVGQVYEITVESSLTDCIGNGVGAFDKARFSLPQTIDVKDIILNEVLYDPVTGGVRFIELYNRSNKVFNVGDLNIADRDEELQDIDSNIEINEEYLFFPGDYLVLTPLIQNIKDEYFVENPNWMIRTSLPSYNDKEDAVIVFVPDILGPRIIDELVYDRDFHNPLLDSEEGVSLERISFSAETQDESNWQSAAETAGFATPTYRNSQFLEGAASGENVFEIPNTTFSPDGDGFEDFLLINYNTTIDGWVANVQLFDANGRLVKKLVQNQTLSANGSFKWEGESDDGTKARIGIYIVWIEVFKSDGTVEHIKKTCVLAGRLN